MVVCAGVESHECGNGECRKAWARVLMGWYCGGSASHFKQVA